MADSANDIFTTWALGPGRESFFSSRKQTTWIPVLLELQGISADNFARGFLTDDVPLLEDEVLQEAWVTTVHVPGLYTGRNETPTDKIYITALVREDFFGFLEDASNQRLRSVVLRSVLGKPLDDAAIADLGSPFPIEQHPAASDQPAEAGTVIVGIIDDGIAFAHERFRKALNETRVEYVWLQGGIFGTAPGPLGLLNGREIRKAEIETLLADATHSGIVDETGVYRAVGMEDFGRIRDLNSNDHKPTAQRAAHGVHVMDVAAGYKMEDGRDDRPIVAVQLPSEVTADTSGQLLEPYLFDAITYILCRAEDITRDRNSGPLPVVINFSFGHAAGPHDGSSPTERALDQAIATRAAPLRIVLPSGNTHLSRTHAQVSFSHDRQTWSLRWRLQPNDLTWSFMEIWLPRGNPANGSRVTIEVETPGGQSSARLGEGDTASVVRLPSSAATDDETYCIVTYAYDAEADRGHFLIAIAPTEHVEPSGSAVASPGVWNVHLKNEDFAPSDLIHAWIQRDDTPIGYPTRGRQSYFDDPGYKRFDEGGRPEEQDSVDSCVKRAGTINGLATGDRTIVIGGVYRREMRAAEYSSGGPTYDADRVGPDASSVSDDTRVHRGILAAGTRSGSKVAINGTSVAAPQIARWIADELAGGSDTAGDRTAVKNRAIIEETTPPERPPRPSDERGGAGRIIRPQLTMVDRFEP